MIIGTYAHSVIVMDDESYIPVGYEDAQRVQAAMEESRPIVTVRRVGYYGADEGTVTFSTKRILRIEENGDRGRF